MKFTYVLLSAVGQSCIFLLLDNSQFRGGLDSVSQIVSSLYANLIVAPDPKRNVFLSIDLSSAWSVFISGLHTQAPEVWE